MKTEREIREKLNELKVMKKWPAVRNSEFNRGANSGEIQKLEWVLDEK